MLVPALMVCPLMAGQVTALIWSLAKEGLVQSLGCGFGAFWADPKGERMCVRGCRAALPAEERVSCVWGQGSSTKRSCWAKTHQGKLCTAPWCNGWC